MSDKRTLPGPPTAPFREGSLLSYVSADERLRQLTGTPNGPDEWRLNQPFRARLVLSAIERGRSSAKFIWVEGLTGNLFPMFMADAFGLMSTAEGVRNGVVDTEWIVVKRGTDYGISPLAAWTEGRGA